MQKKGILIVSFGTSHASTRQKTIGAVEETIRRAYPEAEILSAYTSGVIRRIWESRGEAVLSPEQALSQMAGQGISDVTVQPTHLICGVEFDLLREAVRAFQGRFESLRLGMPLLSSAADRRRGCRRHLHPIRAKAGPADSADGTRNAARGQFGLRGV